MALLLNGVNNAMSPMVQKALDKKNSNSSLEDKLKKRINTGLTNTPQYGGNLNTQAGGLENQLRKMMSQRLSGEGLGMSQEEMNKMMGQTKQTLNEQREKGTKNTLRNMNRRGILSSSVTNEGLSDVADQYSQNLADAQTNMYLQNEQMKRNQMQNAMGQSMNLANMRNQRQQGNIERQLQNFYNQQNLRQQGLQNALGWYNTQQQQEMARKQREQQSQNNLWGTLGGIAGSFLGGPAGGAIGSWFGDQF